VENASTMIVLLHGDEQWALEIPFGGVDEFLATEDGDSELDRSLVVLGPLRYPLSNQFHFLFR
jgi:hypothetical protein